MTTIKNNTLRPFTIAFKNGNQIQQIELSTGLTLNVPDDVVKGLRAHPIFNTYLESGKFDILSLAPGAKSDIGGIPVVDIAEEPNPVNSEPKIEKVASRRVNKA